jgi:predicted transcriptional regulator
MKTQTLQNIFSLMQRRYLTPSSLAIYIFCSMREEKKMSLREISEGTGLSSLIIRHHLKLMQEIKLISWKTNNKNKSEIECSEMSEKQLACILSRCKLPSSLNIYNINTKNNTNNIINNNIKSKKTGRKLSIQAQNSNLESLIRLLPEKHKKFSIAPTNLTRFERLVHVLDSDFEAYCKWFISKKLGKNVHTFGLGIFLYQGIVDEFKTSLVKVKKSNAYKKVSLRKAKFEKEAEALEEEINGLR